MQIRLLAEWMGHQSGTVHKLPDLVASALIGRGAAEKVTPRRKKKEMTAAPVDKMVRGAAKSK